MTTLELAKDLVNLDDVEEVNRRLLVFLANQVEGYGPIDGPRREERDFANRTHHYWLPCILCGAWRGGHERDVNSVMMTRGWGVTVCQAPRCVAEAARLNTLWINGLTEAR